ncbi:probable ATP-dependent RNA helicase DHX37 isoform X2 [Anneissia japonica]|uniref:probable ATP-dependent RNA helicase DHX37 isoform X2 n=1 Tax=Anneissia japonica TaxID=1529436 RepID=UPI00142578C5|nr:probable ATP-dependent RNA helicase DHX37 isoform X2 [Anneissia japonica]
MGRSKPRFNSKARQIVDNSKTPKPVNVKVDIVDNQTTSGYGGCDASNPLVLPSKKTKQGHKKFKDKVVPKKLSKKKRKMLEKVLQRKAKKEKRKDILTSLAEHQASPEEMALFTCTAHLGQKTTKRDADVQLKRNEILCINSVKGANKRRRLETENKKEVSSSDETESSASDSDSELEENKIEDTKMKGLERTEYKEEKNKQNQSLKTAETHRTDIATKEASNKKVSSIKQSECEPAVFVPLKRSQEVQEARLALPILAEEQMIMEAVKENPVVIICGETGSGKTTQVPQFLYEAGFAKKGMIGVTEPRRVAAVNMSQRVGKEMGLGKKKISYQIRYEGTVTNETEMKFMTDGVLLKEIQKDFFLTKYSAIIIDEAHERSVYTDILIGLLSRIVPLRNKKEIPLKLIIMSATLRVEDFTENTSLFKVTPPVIKIESRQFPVTIHFNKKTPLENYVAEAYRKVLKIHRTLPPGGILVFVTGQGEINTLCRKLKARYELRNFKHKKADSKAEKDDEELEEEKDREFKKIKLPRINLDSYSTQPYEEEEVEEDKGEVLEDEHLQDDESEQEDEDDDDKIADALGPSIVDEIPLYVLPMYSLLPPHKQAKVFMPPPQGTRLCVISTNVSETSLTIPGIKYVVDTGRVKKRYYDNVTGVSSFKITWTSKASADQRSGRAGRTEPGHSYRLYSSAVFNSDFEKFDSPEITRKPVDDLILQMKDMGIDKVVNFPFPTPPELEAMKAAERHLIMLGALEQPVKPVRLSDKETFTCKITPLGKAMAAFPVAPCYAKMISLGQQQGCLPYIIALVAALTVREIFEGNVGAGESGEGNEALKMKRAKSSHYKKIWAGKGSAAEFGDLMVLLGAVGATEYAGCTAGFCQAHSLRYKAMVEIRKLRRLLTNAVNAVSPECGVFVDPKMNPPTDLQVKMLREIVLSGLGNHVARLMPDSQEREAKNAYQCVGIEGAVYIHPDSVLFSKLPKFVVYQEIIETSKAYMRGVIAIEPGWLALLLPHLCTFSKPHEKPSPRYDPKTGTVRCHMTATFGRNAWQLPCQELAFPPSPDRFKWFARFLLEGQVFSGLKKYTSCLLSPPSTMVKTWARLQPRTQTLLNTLAIKRVDSKETLTQAWQEDSNYLIAAYKEWLPESKHVELANTWPPES